jgi:hypothetical protein
MLAVKGKKKACKYLNMIPLLYAVSPYSILRGVLLSTTTLLLFLFFPSLIFFTFTFLPAAHREPHDGLHHTPD